MNNVFHDSLTIESIFSNKANIKEYRFSMFKNNILQQADQWKVKNNNR